jgi:hypothetical protein
MAQIQLRTYQQILGNMISQLLATTDLNDVSPGSVFLTLLEAAASSDFTQEGKLLQLINLNDVDKAKGTDLENLAAELGVTPSREGATSSSAQVTITDTAFSKISSNVYAGTISPAAGDTTLNIVSANAFTASGTVYVGRGTATQESVSYTSKTNNGNYWTLNLSSPLQKNHFVGEEVVLAQGGDRTIIAGTVVQVPASSGSPAIQFNTTIQVIIPDGENKVQGVTATAVTPGSAGNVGLNKITQFQAAPFSTAAVTNDQVSATGGQDTETDAQLRQRIKDHVHNIGKGTETAIISGVVGVSDPDQGNRVVSAFLREPTDAGALAILFIDDGTGFSPTFSGVGVENIITNAIGTEQFVQLQNFPIVKSQVASIGTEPFALQGGERLRFIVDGIAEEQPLANTQYRTPGVVLAQEIVQTINAVFTTVEARAREGQVFVVPVKDEPDYIQVAAASSNDANAIIRFPVNKQHTLRLYESNRLLNKNGSDATIQSFPNTAWPTFAGSETLQLNIDGISSPTITFTDAIFANLTSSLTIAAASPSDWAIVINALIIGVTANARTDGTFTITSNKGAIPAASISVIGGSLAGRLIDASASSVGVASEYTLNRLLGQVQLANPMPANGQLDAGTTLTQGFVRTSAQPIFSLPATLGTAAQIPIVVDAPGTILPVSQTVGTLTYSTSTPGIQRITGTVGQFSSLLPDDWGFFYNLSITGFVRVLDIAINGSFVDVFYPNPIAGGPDTPDALTKQFVFFRSAGLPQLITLPIGVAVTDAAVISAINSQIVGGVATQLDNNVIQIATQRLDGSAALFIPLLAGSANNLGFLAGNYANNDPELAVEESGDLAGYPTGKITIATPDLVAPYDTLIANGTPFTLVDSHDRPILNYIGAQAELIRVPKQKNSSSQLTMREDAPLQIDPIGSDLRAVQTRGMEFGQTDNMVIIMDDNPTEKTFDIPMYVDATIAAPSVPSTTQFDAADMTGALLGVSTRWLGMRFEDYRVWFQARADMAHSGSNDQIRVTAVPFGPAGKTFKFGIFYPSAPSASSAATYSIDTTNGQILINLVLGSSAARSIGLVPGTLVKISSTGPVGSTYTWKVQFTPPVTLTPVQIGDVVSITDPAFNSSNLVQFAVQSLSNLSDSSRNYQFLQENFNGCTVSGSGVNFTLGGVPTQTLSNGDKLLITGIQTNATVVGANTITVATGGAYATGGGALVILSNNYTYTAYNSGTGVFTGVTPDPNGVVSPGDAILQNVSTTASLVASTGGPSSGTASPALYSDGSFFNITLTHAHLTADFAPSFSVSAGDIIQAASQTLTVTSVVSPKIYAVDTPFAFTGNQPGVVSRIYVIGTKTVAAVTEADLASTSTGVQILQLNAGSNSASSLIQTVNNTAGVKDLVTASNAPSSNGSGTISTSTEDLLANGSTRQSLLNGESWVYSTNSSSPGLTLKVPFDFSPTIGDKIRLVPQTPMNIRDHFNRKQISGLSSAAEVDLVNEARRVQVSSLTPGGVGQVFAVGGKASGNNVLPISGIGQQISSSVGVIELDHSALDLLNPGHMIRLSQAGRAKKNYPSSQPVSGTTAQIQTVSATTAQLTFGVPLSVILSYTHTGTVIWVVRQLPRGRLRFEVFSGTASLPGSIQTDDWVFVGDGTSYAGTTPIPFFSAANKGYFQIRETDASTYFDVDATGFEEYVSCTAAPFVFFTYHSARVGDQIVIANNSPFNANNQGTFPITAVISTTAVQYTNPLANNQGPTAIGSGGLTSISVLDQGYSTYRNVTTLAPNPSDPTNTSLVVVSPGYNLSLLNEGQQATVTLPNRLGFSSDPVPGISGYQYWTGLKRTVQRTVDGYAPDSTDFPGIRAAGVAIEVREPQIQQVAMTIQVTTNQGVALSAISDTIISSVVGYINSLGLGQSVFLSQIVSIIQAVSGVQSVVLTNPKLDTELITINDNAIARTSSNLIILTTPAS